MSTAPGKKITRQAVLRFLSVAAIYIASDRAGALLVNPRTHASPVWPAAGVSIAALYFFGIRFWPAIFVGSAVANALTPDLGGVGVFLAAADCLQAVAGTMALRFFSSRVVGKTNLRDAAGVLAAALASLASDASTGAVYLRWWQALSDQAFWSAWFSWLAGDVIGILVVLPLFLAVLARYNSRKPLAEGTLQRLRRCLGLLDPLGKPVSILTFSRAFGCGNLAWPGGSQLNCVAFGRNRRMVHQSWHGSLC
jgi:integral membrane sensor domain MASE1